MTTTTQPRRWLEEAPSELPDGLAAGLRGYGELGPSVEQQLRIWGQLAQATAPTHAEPSQTSAAPGALSLRSKLKLGLLLTAAALACWWYATRAATANTTEHQPATQLAEATPELPSSAKALVAPLGLAMPQSTAAPVTGVPEPARNTTSRSLPPRATRAAERARPTPAGPSPAAGDPAAELELLTRARRVLYSAPARALQLTEEHARIYPRGMFAEEREILAIDALVRSGRVDQARQRSRAFMHSYPHSAGVERIKALLGEP